MKAQKIIASRKFYSSLDGEKKKVLLNKITERRRKRMNQMSESGLKEFRNKNKERMRKRREELKASEQE